MLLHLHSLRSQAITSLIVQSLCVHPKTVHSVQKMPSSFRAISLQKPPLDHIMSQLNTFHTLPPYLSKIQFNILRNGATRRKVAGSISDGVTGIFQ
jgi:hypothetical protein